MSVSPSVHAATLPLGVNVGRLRPARIAAIVLVAATLVALAASDGPRFLQATHFADRSPATQHEIARLGGSPAAPSAQVESELSSLPLAAQASISGVLGRDDRAYHASATAHGFRGENPAHGLTADFAGSGVLVETGAARLGLTLRSIGYGDELRPVAAAAPTATKNRVEYRRGELTEWYVNGPLGLEQGFTLAAPPARRTSKPLTLAVTLSGTLHASLAQGATGLDLALAGRPTALRYRGLAAWDATGRALPARLALDGSSLLVRVDDASARYPLTIDPLVQQAKLTASDGAADDNFGFSVAVSGDTVVVGVYSDDVGANVDQGSAYVFVRPVGGWASGNETAKLTASDGAANDFFGRSVAVSGDTVIAGAFNDDVGANVDQGSAYVFVKQGGGWASGTQSAKLTASDGAAFDLFGLSVAVSGDTVIAGAYNDDVGANMDQGSAYVFVKQGGGWASGTQTATLTASDGAADDRFGLSVAVSGDTVVIGEPLDDFGANVDQGSAYLFVKPGGGWVSGTQLAKLTASDGAAVDRFGFSVAVSGDTVVAGAYLDDVGANVDQGSAYIFVKPGGGWASGTQSAKLTASDGAGNNWFGWSVAVSGDTVVAGASHASSAYLFVKPGGGWASGTQTAKLTASDGAALDFFGSSVSVDGDTVVVGAWADDVGAHADQGSAYVFGSGRSGIGGGAGTQPKLTGSDGLPSDRLGRSVAVSGDTIVVGAYADDIGANVNQGAAYVFVKPGTGWAGATEVAKLTASDGAGADFFGLSVAVSGDTVVVGAWFDDVGANGNQGSAYVFVKPGGGWASGTQTAKLTASDGAPDDRLGLSVALSGDTVVAGGDGDDVGAYADQGSAYVFVKPGGGWANGTQTAKLTASDGEAGDALGLSVAVSGDTIVSGASADDAGANADQGSAYVFVKPGGGWANGTQTAKLTASDGEAGDLFGWSVAVSGDTVVAAASGDDVGANADQGSAYVFVKPGGGWTSATQTAKLTASDGAPGDLFGYSATISGDTVVAGAYGDDAGASADQGSAYVFVKAAGGWASSTQSAKLTALDGAADDQFGLSVALSAGTLVVGAYGDDVGASINQGSAYVLTVQTGTGRR